MQSMKRPARQRDNRSERRTSVDMILNKYVNGEPHLCRAVNLSRGGMLLKKIFEPDLSQHAVTLEFQLPGSEEIIRAEGMALMESPQARSVGVRFTQMSAESIRMLERFLHGPIEHATARRA